MRRASCAALAVAVSISGGIAACNTSVDDAEARRRASARTVDADTRPKVSMSPHTRAPEPLPVPIDAATPDTEGEEAGARWSPGVSDGDQTLVGEARERDPGSDVVTIKVIVDARRQAHVNWGRKDFGAAPLEIQRPRNSGPLDLVVVAPGYLPHHARALTDRDDVIMLRLYTAAEAPQLLGYRSSEVPRAPAATGQSERAQGRVRDQVQVRVVDKSKDLAKKAPKAASGETPKKK